MRTSPGGPVLHGRLQRLREDGDEDDVSVGGSDSSGEGGGHFTNGVVGALSHSSSGRSRLGGSARRLRFDDDVDDDAESDSDRFDDDAWRHAHAHDADDVAALARLARLKGLGDAKARRHAWPKLLGIDVARIDAGAYDTSSHPDVADTHKDARVVAVDVARAMWGFTRGWSAARRHAKLCELRSVIDAAICVHEEAAPGLVSYYQGFHDVASVVVMVCCEESEGSNDDDDDDDDDDDARGYLAAAILERLVLFHLRDCTRPTLEPVVDALGLLPHLMRLADEEVADHVESAGVHPFFAVSWLLTWHAHGLAGGGAIRGGRSATSTSDSVALAVASRLFDLFLVSHPLAPLYVGVASIVAQRDDVLAAGREDPGELHQALNALPLVSSLRRVPDGDDEEEAEEEEAWGEDGSVNTAAATVATDDAEDEEGRRRRERVLNEVDLLLARARRMMGEHPPEVLFEKASLRPPIGSASDKYPWPWWTHDVTSVDLDVSDGFAAMDTNDVRGGDEDRGVVAMGLRGLALLFAGALMSWVNLARFGVFLARVGRLGVWHARIAPARAPRTEADRARELDEIAALELELERRGKDLLRAWETRKRLAQSPLPDVVARGPPLDVDARGKIRYSGEGKWVRVPRAPDAATNLRGVVVGAACAALVAVDILFAATVERTFVLRWLEGGANALDVLADPIFPMLGRALSSCCRYILNVAS